VPPPAGSVTLYARRVRIVAVADTHLYHRGLVVPDGDVLVHAGDLCRGGSLAELEIAADWLRALPHAHKIVIAGNHDFAFERHPDEARRVLGDGVGGLVYLEDAAATVDGVKFWGSPWQPRFFDWAFNLSRGAPLAAKWRLIPDDVDVLVTHGPPHGIGDRVARGHEGCEDLLARVRVVRPLLHLFGHIHEDPGVWVEAGVTHANVTTAEGELAPTVFDLDRKQRRVRRALPRG